MNQCSVKECNVVIKNKTLQLCDKHYKRFLRKGSTELIVPKRDPICTIINCNNKHFGLGFCSKHYQQYKKTNPVSYRQRLPQRIIKPCSIKGCSNNHQAHGFCKMHLQRLEKHGDPLTTVRAPAGSGYINKQGYKVIYVNGSQKLEHRYLMEQKLGRELLSQESVHHINGERSDNRLENLELWSKSQPSGQRVEDKIKWAWEILALYGGVL